MPRQDATHRLELDVRPLENAINSLKETLNGLCSVLNRSLIKESSSQSELFVVDRRAYYHAVPGERSLLRAKHPFETFETDKLPLLSKKRLDEYNDAKVFARGNRALAYFLFKNKGLSKSTKADIGRIFRWYLKEMKRVSYEDIYIYMDRFDAGKNRTFNYLSKVAFCRRRLVTFSYRFDGGFPEIKFSTAAKARPNSNRIKTSQVWRAHKLLVEMKDYENALILRIMFTFALMPYELRMLRFEDVHRLRTDNKVIRFYHPRRSKVVTLSLPEQLFKEIQSYKVIIKGKKRNCISKIRTTFKNRRTKEHFIFDVTKKTILRRFRTGFNNRIPNFSYTTTEIRAAAKLNQRQL